MAYQNLLSDDRNRVYVADGEAAVLRSRLPREYQEVEWIESSGNQRIEFVYPSKIKEWDIAFDVQFNAASVRTLVGFSTTGTTYFGKDAGGNIELGEGIKMNVSALIRHRIEFTRTAISEGLYRAMVRVGNTSITRDHRTGGEYETLSIPMSSYKGNGLKTYSIRHNGYMNLIPCYRKSDRVIGMYDLCGSICPLTGTPFYINSGTGTFTKGADAFTPVDPTSVTGGRLLVDGNGKAVMYGGKGVVFAS